MIYVKKKENLDTFLKSHAVTQLGSTNVCCGLTLTQTRLIRKSPTPEVGLYCDNKVYSFCLEIQNKVPSFQRKYYRYFYELLIYSLISNIYI